MFTDVNRIASESIVCNRPNVHDTAITNGRNGLHSAERIWPRPLLNVDDSPVFTAGREGDRRERPDDALIGAAEAFEVTPGSIRGDLRIRLSNDLSFGAARECRHLGRRVRRDREARIAPLDEKRPHLLTHVIEEFRARDVVAVRQLNRGRAVLARIGNPRVEEQLMSAHDGALRDRTKPPNDGSGKLVRARAANDVRVVDAYIDHA